MVPPIFGRVPPFLLALICSPKSGGELPEHEVAKSGTFQVSAVCQFFCASIWMCATDRISLEKRIKISWDLVLQIIGESIVWEHHKLYGLLQQVHPMPGESWMREILPNIVGSERFANDRFESAVRSVDLINTTASWNLFELAAIS